MPMPIREVNTESARIGKTFCMETALCPVEETASTWSGFFVDNYLLSNELCRGPSFSSLICRTLLLRHRGHVLSSVSSETAKVYSQPQRRHFSFASFAILIPVQS